MCSGGRVSLHIFPIARGKSVSQAEQSAAFPKGNKGTRGHAGSWWQRPWKGKEVKLPSQGAAILLVVQRGATCLATQNRAHFPSVCWELS